MALVVGVFGYDLRMGGQPLDDRFHAVGNGRLRRERCQEEHREGENEKEAFQNEEVFVQGNTSCQSFVKNRLPGVSLPLASDRYCCVMLLSLIGEEGISLHGLVDLLPDALDDLLVLGIGQHLVNEVGDEVHHVFFGAACCHGSCAQADA